LYFLAYFVCQILQAILISKYACRLWKKIMRSGVGSVLLLWNSDANGKR
jgi:hypothetical protein